jgi:predicted Zn-ribbon and HTH transcriptional regulator
METYTGSGTRPSLEVMEIFRLHGEEYKNRYPLSLEQRKAMADITRCRTATLGGHVDVCDQDCGFTRISYNSCRNRHCPKCQSLSQAKWLQNRKQRLLPTHYFHIVVTLPHELNPLVLQNKEILYDLFFQAASQALQKLALGYPRLKALLGFTAVLHTWNQDLQLHPHLHLVVTGGGLDPSGDRWVCSKNNFLLPVKALSQVVRGKFLDALQRAFQEGKLLFRGTMQGLKEGTTSHRFLMNRPRILKNQTRKNLFQGLTGKLRPMSLIRRSDSYAKLKDTHSILFNSKKNLSSNSNQPAWNALTHGPSKTLLD